MPYACDTPLPSSLLPAAPEPLAAPGAESEPSCCGAVESPVHLAPSCAPALGRLRPSANHTKVRNAATNVSAMQ